MDAKNITGLLPSAPRVSHHRLPPYLRPAPGSPIYLGKGVQGRGVFPLNRPDQSWERGVSPLNRPDQPLRRDLPPRNRPDYYLGRVVSPCKGYGPKFRRGESFTQRPDQRLRRGAPTLNPQGPNLEKGVSPLNRPDNLTENDGSYIKDLDLSEILPLDMTLPKSVKVVTVVKSSRQIREKKVDSVTVVSPVSTAKKGNFSRPQKHRSESEDEDEDSETDENEIPPPLMPPAHTNGRMRRGRLTRSRKEVEVYLVTSFAGLTLVSTGRSADASTAGEAEGCGDLDLGSRKVTLAEPDPDQEEPLDLSRKRKRNNLVITISGKQRKIETSSIDDLEIRDSDPKEHTHECTEASTHIDNDSDVVMDRPKRRSWRRKPGNSSTTTSSRSCRRHIRRLDETPHDLSCIGQ